MKAYRPVAISTLFLFLFAVVGTGMVALTFENTADRIAENERRALLQRLNEVIPAERHDNDVFSDVLYVTNSELLGTSEPVPVYRARKDGWPVAAVLAPVAPDGYNGAIRLLVAINVDGTLAGVRVVQHHETPGLGDAIEAERSDWILTFKGKSLGNPPAEGWRVRRDGGTFDQFTGATITPRAVVNAVRKALVYFQRHRQTLFERPPRPEAEQ
ncbi:MAG: electron transport complex subunit RsxG [Gammaproteobacteria bacterium]|jgi:electron transport complex protein RnfG